MDHQSWPIRRWDSSHHHIEPGSIISLGAEIHLANLFSEDMKPWE